jgi:hypothetical protein
MKKYPLGLAVIGPPTVSICIRRAIKELRNGYTGDAPESVLR